MPIYNNSNNPYVTTADITTYIQPTGLSQSIDTNSYQYQLTQKVAVSIAKSYLRNKYDINEEFSGVANYDTSSIFTPNQLVNYNGPILLWSITS